MPTATPEPTPTPLAQAIVRGEAVNVREGPSARKGPNGQDIYRPIERKQRGDVLEVLGRGILDNPWVQVRLDGDRTGWVSTDPAFAELTVPIETLPLVGWYPPTGILQTTTLLNGSHDLEVVNNRTRDTVLVLAQDAKPVVAVYVRSGDQGIVSGIPDGTYEIFDSTGADWNGREFMMNAQRFRWREPLPYELSEDGSATIWTLTVGASDDSAGDSQESEDVDESDFPEITTEG